jgi:hypothetical protein
MEPGCWEDGPEWASFLLVSQLVPNPLQGHLSHEGDGKIILVPVSVIIHVLLKIVT